MKSLARLAALASAAVTLLSATSAAAVDVRNEDERVYPMTVTSTAMSRDVSLRGLSLSLFVCVGACEFKVDGVGTVKASGQEIITIRGGRFVMDKPQAEAR